MHRRDDGPARGALSRGRRRPPATALVLPLAVTVAGCAGGAPTYAPSPSTQLPQEYRSLVLDDGERPTVLVAPDTTGAGGPTQYGSARVDIAETTTASGKVARDAAPQGHRAFRFPRYTAAAKYPRAVITVANRGRKDALSPGDRPFAWGAVFRLDPVSAGRAQDNGDNILQRGLYSEDALYKAEVDGHRAGCTVRGADGLLTVRTPDQLRPGVWYAMRCEREHTRLRVEAWVVGRRDETSMSASDFGAMGTVRMGAADIPISIGGKVSWNGKLVTSDSDQFNGEIAEAFVVLGLVA